MLEWLERGSGLIALISGIVIVAVLVVLTAYVAGLYNRISVQRLRILGFNATDTATRENYAEFIVGNRSFTEVGITAIIVKNGGIAFDLTELYCRKAGLPAGSKILLEQRGALRFRVTEEELASVLVDAAAGKKLYTLRLCVVDCAGVCHSARVPAVKKLLAGHLVRSAARLRAAGSSEPESEPEPVEEPASEPVAPVPMPAPTVPASPSPVPMPAPEAPEAPAVPLPEPAPLSEAKPCPPPEEPV